MPTLRPVPLLTALLALALFAGVLGGCAAQRHTKHGQAALLADDPVAARHHFRRALEHDARLAEAPEFAEDFRVAKRDAAVVEGDRALRQNKPTSAIERYGAALRLEPDWPAAAAGLAAAHRDAADACHALALRAADVGDLSAAQDHLETALKHVPGHGRAAAALASLDAPAAAHPASYRQALENRAARAWDEALKNIRLTVSAHPDFLPARAALPDTLDDAARDHLARGRAALAEGRFNDAEATLLRVLDYRPEHPQLDPALGAVDLARGDADLAAGLPGAALVWYRQAQRRFDDHPDGHAARVGVRTATQTIYDRHRLDIHPVAQADGDDLADELTARVRDRLRQRDAAALRLGPAGEAVPIAVGRLDLPAPAVRTERRRHAYDVEFDVPNPEIPRLKHELHEVERCLWDLRSRESRLCARYEHLKHHDPHAAQRLYHELHRVRGDIHDAQRKQRRLTRELRDAPAFVTEVRTEYWPYTVEHHTRTVRLTASATPADTPRVRADAELTDGDATVLDARPDLGLDEDPLQLETDATLRERLLDRAADRIAGALVDRRVAALRAEAAALKTSDPVASREAGIAADVLRRR